MRSHARGRPRAHLLTHVPTHTWVFSYSVAEALESPSSQALTLSRCSSGPRPHCSPQKLLPRLPPTPTDGLGGASSEPLGPRGGPRWASEASASASQPPSQAAALWGEHTSSADGLAPSGPALRPGREITPNPLLSAPLSRSAPLLGAPGVRKDLWLRLKHRPSP